MFHLIARQFAKHCLVCAARAYISVVHIYKTVQECLFSRFKDNSRKVVTMTV